MTFGDKTNKNWYPYKDMGSYYKLENGVLLFCPMGEDGTRDDSEGEVDFNLLEGEWLTPEKLITDRLKEIGYELSVKI